MTRTLEKAALLALVALPLLAARLGAPGPRVLALNLGPGDAPYVLGFAPEYEIDDKVGTHWTTYHAAVALPVEVRGGPVTLSYRFARVFGETAQVEVSFAGRPVDRFAARGGAVVERTAPVGPVPPTRVHIALEADSHERKDRGLKLDWVRVTVGERAHVRLIGGAAVAPGALVALVVLFHLAAGWGRRGALFLSLPWALALVVGLRLDPWLTHRVLRGLPLALVLFGGAGLLVGHLRRRRGRASASSLRLLAALGLAAFLGRAAVVNHPDFYYPDQRTHARLVEKVQEQGPWFFASPSRAIWEHGVWRTEAYGRTYAFPYSPAFHLPFTVLGLGYDTLLLAMKLTAAAVSVAPLLLTWALARRLGASVLGAGLMLLVPTYTSRLSFAFFPSLFGHAFDLAFLYWLAGHLDRLRAPRVWLQGMAWVAGAQLAYVSGVMNTAVLVAALLVALLVRRRTADAAALAALGLAGALLSLVLYYRDFLGMVLDVAPRVGEPAASRYPIQSFFAVAYRRTRDFFDGVYPVLAAAGLWHLGRDRPPADAAADASGPPAVTSGARRTLLFAWLGAYLLLLLGRAKVPDIFLHGHETLLVTPLVCLSAGVALAWLAGRGAPGRVAAALVGILLSVQGLQAQWASVALQLANAR